MKQIAFIDISAALKSAMFNYYKLIQMKTALQDERPVTFDGSDNGILDPF